MLSSLSRAPFVGVMAFFVVLFVQALGHTVMILMEHIFGVEYQYHVAFAMGALGAVMIYVGVRKGHNEVAATWLGFFGGTFLWTGWVEFSFVFASRHLGVQHLMSPDGVEIITKAEYLVMPSSLGVLMASLVFFYFNRETRCNAFRWMHRNLRMPVGKPTPGYQRNIATITAMETIYITWFFYIFLLVIYDETILGDRHPVTYTLFFMNTAWALYLLNRLVRFNRLTSAIRYGIPTAIIAWNSVELLGRWNFFQEIWTAPLDHGLEMAMVFGAVVVATIATVMFPSGKVDTGESQAT